MKIANIIDENIFRGYDIRGIYNDNLTIDVAYTIGLAFGTKLKKENKKETVIGYDNRESSPALFKALAQGITKTGINVINLGLVTTPMYYYALGLFQASSGIMITGSHNPKEYNGFKMTFNGIYNAYGEYIQEFKQLVLKKEFVTGQGQIREERIEERYLKHVTDSINLGPYKRKIVVDCGNGTPSIIIEKVLQSLNIDYIPLYCESNPDYPNHHPDPSVQKNLVDLQQKVIETKADAGFAYDGDGDRVGLVNDLGKPMGADHFMIIIIRDLVNKLDDKRFLYDVKCSKALEDEICKLGGTPICYRTGNSYMRAKVIEDNIKFAGELSGHIFFNDKFNGFDDGIYASLRMIEILTHTPKTVSELLEGINQYYSTEELKIKVPDDIKFKKIETVKKYCQEKNYNILTIDGCKVLFDDGFALIRASNTGPNITMRFEATTKERLTEIQTEFENLLKTI
jgi:phosphomannomutase/phosphoglucomutase